MGACCRSKTTALFIGIVNLVAGTVGLVALYFILTTLSDDIQTFQHQLESQSQSRPSQQTEQAEQELDTLVEFYWSVILAYIFPTVVTLLVGFTVVLAAAYDNEYLLLISIFLNAILILACVSVGLVMFVLMIHWVFLAPLGALALLQLIFTCALLFHYITTSRLKPPTSISNSTPIQNM